MNKILLGLRLMLMSIFWTTSGTYAVNFDVQDMKFGINGYLDLEYTYISKSPVEADEGIIETRDEQSYFDQDHMNLLFGVEKDKFRGHLNLQSLHSFSSGDDQGDFEILEAYGEYIFTDILKNQGRKIFSAFRHLQ